MAIDILHKILGIQTGAFDGLTAFSVRKSRFSPGNDRVRPGKITYFGKENRFSPAPPDRSVGRRQGVCAAYRLPLPVGEVPAGRRGPSQSPSVTAPPKGEPRALHVTPPTSNLPRKLPVKGKGCDGRAGGHNALKPQKHPLPGWEGMLGSEFRT